MLTMSPVIFWTNKVIRAEPVDSHHVSGFKTGVKVRATPTTRNLNSNPRNGSTACPVTYVRHSLGTKMECLPGLGTSIPILSQARKQ